MTEKVKKLLDEVYAEADQVYQRGMEALIMNLGYKGTRQFLARRIADRSDSLRDREEYLKEFEDLTIEEFCQLSKYEREHPRIDEPPKNPDDALYRIGWNCVCDALGLARNGYFHGLIKERANMHEEFLNKHEKALKDSVNKREAELEAFKDSLLDKHRPVPREERDVINDALFLARQKVKVYPAGELVEVDGGNYIGA
jgi:hypothetical protein